MYRLIFCIFLSLVSVESYAGFWGPSNPFECMKKYYPKMKFTEGYDLLLFSCAMGYQDGLPSENIKAGKCIAGDSGNFYSYESALKVILQCTKSNPILFTAFKSKLINEQESFNRAYESDKPIVRSREDEPKSISIFDAKTGTYRNCTQTGSAINCF